MTDPELILEIEGAERSVLLAGLEKWIVENYAERCEPFDANEGCLSCSVWDAFDRLKVAIPPES